jgi:tetratricopeptide (TPR) repeat protein
MARRTVWLWSIIGTVVVLLLGAGILIRTRAELAQMPPLLTWDGPEPTSGVHEVEARLVKAVQVAPRDARAALDLGKFYLDDARPYEAAWVLADARRLDPRSAQPRLLLARALAAGQLYQPAIDLLQTAIHDFPKDTEAPQQLADLLLSLGRPADAVTTLQSGSKQQSLSADGLLLLGRALEADGRDAEALTQYQAYQQQQPKSDQIYLRIGKVMLRMGKTGDAQQAFMATQVLNSHNAESWYYQGLLALRQGPAKEEEARQRFAQAVAANERFALAHVQLGRYYQRHRDWGKATAVLQRAFELEPENDEALQQLAHVRQAVGDAAGASYYQGLYYDVKDARSRATSQYEAMAASGADPRGPLMVSNAYIRMDQKQRASVAAREGLKRFPGDRDLTERLIALDLLTGDLKEAEALCVGWTRREPQAAQPIYLLGRVRLANHDVSGALMQLRQAAQREPKNPEYQFAIGSAYAENASDANWGRAARYYGQAVTLKPDDARYRLNLGLALQNLHDFEGARRQFLRSMDLDPNQSAPLNNLVQVARGLDRRDQIDFWGPLVREVEGRLRDELPRWKRVWDRPADADGYAPLAQFLMRTGELKKARNVLEQAVALRPDLPAARRDLTTLRRTLDVL